jgi:hypothetical protein
MGHAWDQDLNASKYINSLWYTTSNGKPVYETEKISTWWENKIRTENGIGLRGGYSYDASVSPWKVESNVAILVNGARQSSVVNIFGIPFPKNTNNLHAFLKILMFSPYTY